MTDYHYQAEYEDPPDDDGRAPRETGRRESNTFFPGWGDLGRRWRGSRTRRAEEAAEALSEDTDVIEDEPYAAGENYRYADDVEAYPDDGGAYAEPEEDYYADQDDDAGDLEERDEGASVAAAGAAATRRIRFDPTKERGAEYYDRAVRHSRTVRWLKFLLPGLALLGIAAFLAFIQFAPDPGSAVITLSGINVEDKSVTMTKPHISGFEGTRRSYEVRAVQAVQDLNNPNIVRMNDVTARLGMGNDETAHVQAKSGTYNGDTNNLVLTDGITVDTTNGYKATLQDAQIDITTGAMVSSNPLEVATAHGTVKAHAVEVQDQGKHIVFKDGVTVVYTPPDDATDGAASGGQPAAAGKDATSGDKPPAGADAAKTDAADGAAKVKAQGDKAPADTAKTDTAVGPPSDKPPADAPKTDGAGGST
jgi:lipopolysaccharide export system protein LptC